MLNQGLGVNQHLGEWGFPSFPPPFCSKMNQKFAKRGKNVKRANKIFVVHSAYLLVKIYNTFSLKIQQLFVGQNIQHELIIWLGSLGNLRKW